MGRDERKDKRRNAEVEDQQEMKAVLSKVLQDFKKKQQETTEGRTKFWKQIEEPEKLVTEVVKQEWKGWLVRCPDNIARIVVTRALRQSLWRSKHKAWVHIPKQTKKNSKEVMCFYDRDIEEEELARLIEESQQAEVYAASTYK